MKNLQSIKFIESFPYQHELDIIIQQFNYEKKDNDLMYNNIGLIFWPNEIEYYFKKINLYICNIRNYEYNKLIISDNIEFNKMHFISYQNVFLYLCNDIKEIYNNHRILKLI